MFGKAVSKVMLLILALTAINVHAQVGFDVGDPSLGMREVIQSVEHAQKTEAYFTDNQKETHCTYGELEQGAYMDSLVWLVCVIENEIDGSQVLTARILSELLLAEADIFVTRNDELIFESTRHVLQADFQSAYPIIPLTVTGDYEVYLRIQLGEIFGGGFDEVSVRFTIEGD